MSESWKIIPDFPMYSVSDYGRVMNNDNGKFLKSSMTRKNVAKVGLVLGGKQYTRGLAHLVAEAFVEGQDDIHNTLIHLDGDPEHNHAFNLAWRPRWFSWKYHRQFEEMANFASNGPVFDSETGDRYSGLLDAAMSNGLLISDITRSIKTGEKTFPTGQTFESVV